MKSSICFSVAACLALALTGCAGGGGGSSAAPSPQPVIPAPVDPIVPIIPPVVVLTPAQIEYNLNPALGLAGVQAAYDAGFTGTGVSVAVIDSGVTASHSELAANLSRANIMERATIATHTGNMGNSYYGVAGWEVASANLSGDQVAKIGYTMTDSNQIYASAPTITITGDGTGATAEALLGSDGKIKGIVVTNAGAGYTHASATTSDGTSNIVISDAFIAGADEFGHGTFVTTQIGAQADDAGIRGVANNATLFTIKASGTGTGSNAIFMDNVVNGVAWAQSKNVNIVNQSFGAYADMGGYTNISNYVTAQQANISFVTAAGNEGTSCLVIGDCSRPAALPWEASMASSNMLTQDGAWIVVGALNADASDIASFSNRAGITKSNYILAPGTGNVGGNIAGGLESGNGTSYATPIVSGAMALMYQKWPALTGRAMADILFATADDMGAVGVDDIYGNGKLNLNKAFSPVGVVGIPVASVPSGKVAAVNTTSIQLAGTGMSTGSAMGMSLQSFGSIDNTIVLDSYQRDFNVKMSSAVVATESNGINFDDYANVRLGKLIVGVNGVTGDGAVGYQYDKSLSIMGTVKKDLFGTTASGALGFDNSKTYYLNAKKIYTIDDFRLEGQLTYGYGQADASNGSMIKNVSDVQGVGGKVRASYFGFGASYEVPMRVVSGSMDFSVPVSQTADGYVNYENSTAKLAPNALEQKMGVFFQKKGNLLSFLAEYNHVVDKFNIGGFSDDEVSASLYYYF
jgi:subtilisin family serine protease